MTADRFGAVSSGEFTALAAARDHADPVPGPPEADPQRAAPKRPAASSPWRLAIPPQHGAWAFLIVPVLCAFAISGASAAGWLFLGAWVAAYPVGYYLGRALTARARRGSWTRLARRERDRAIPWVILTALLGLPLAITRPWLLAAAALLAVVWIAGLFVAARRGERSLANDLLLVAQAGVALPLAVGVVAGPPEALDALRAPTLQATLIVTGYLAGSVLHVKSILREAGKASFRWANVSWHAALVIVGALLNLWWLVGLVPALIRCLLLRPGMRPGAIGGVEAVVAVLVVAAAFLCL
ncbi:MAG: YwiC-like family protein [Candidatus Nanopelagicales bacterium]